ncbi:rod shape-determining protein [candidate division KSB1 bacterium]|nr:rod shape-determining protein [candidate division KSB1 bacterium]NIR72154.1 rod shape-determining protein [candidate division KSB1 bacterium]NIS26619.1 rod shape-determining protein [candidate division KSB1 bacterium]NIT73387.1 rod shape-determining protein [candidate division KSB1 bacterium]NIU27235.1 rod shape-determining protein [candidate division KSB1 bacterium]
MNHSNSQPFWNKFFANDIAIDLGTANTLVYVKGRGILINEPSIVAIRKSDQQILAYGNDAKTMMGRTPGDLVTVRPLKDGVIADFDLAEKMIRHFIKKVQTNRFIRPRIAVCIPSGITEVERRAVRDSAEHAGGREIYLIQEPMAAAIGVNLPIDEPVGSMVIDVGGGTTEIAVISLSGIVTDISIRIGGDEMNEAIIQYFKKAYNLLIGDNTAEAIKITMGSAEPYKSDEVKMVKGRNLVDGIPKTVKVSSREIQEALAESVGYIVDAVKLCLERTPPELASDILDRGIVLTGGGAMLKGLDERLRLATKLPIIMADDPLTCVVLGTGRIFDDISNYQKLLSNTKRY